MKRQKTVVRAAIVAFLLGGASACSGVDAKSSDDEKMGVSTRPTADKQIEDGNSVRVAIDESGTAPVDEGSQVVVVTSGEVTLSKNTLGGDHIQVVLDHENADAPTRKYLLAAPYTYEVNGAVAEFHGSAGTLLEFLAPPEVEKRFPHLMSSSGWCGLVGTTCEQSTCDGSCSFHGFPVAHCKCN